MSNLLILIVVGLVFYLINRNYKSSDFERIKVDGKQRLEGDLANHEAGLLVALMAKVAKADGAVSELEAEVLSHTFTDISNHFENSDHIRNQLKSIYNKEKESFENTIDLAKKYLKLTKKEYHKRLKVMEYLLNLAFIDGDFSKTEFMITEDIANALEILKSDFENLVSQFEQFYTKRKNDQQLSLQKACQILGVNEDDDFAKIKKEYRNLVKKHHPDIIAGQGASQNIIDEATAKLQQINEAYEILKKHKGV
ncbi:MAG: TerB family tellurite resistance protein [Campylobacterales bacterium]|nr:TerB family tellurite resistance protein [Campylobacterales bacterium]